MDPRVFLFRLSVGYKQVLAPICLRIRIRGRGLASTLLKIPIFKFILNTISITNF